MLSIILVLLLLLLLLLLVEMWWYRSLLIVFKFNLFTRLSGFSAPYSSAVLSLLSPSPSSSSSFLPLSCLLAISVLPPSLNLNPFSPSPSGGRGGSRCALLTPRLVLSDRQPAWTHLQWTCKERKISFVLQSIKTDCSSHLFGTLRHLECPTRRHPREQHLSLRRSSPGERRPHASPGPALAPGRGRGQDSRPVHSANVQSVLLAVLTVLLT